MVGEMGLIDNLQSLGNPRANKTYAPDWTVTGGIAVLVVIGALLLWSIVSGAEVGAVDEAAVAEERALIEREEAEATGPIAAPVSIPESTSSDDDTAADDLPSAKDGAAQATAAGLAYFNGEWSGVNVASPNVEVTRQPLAQPAEVVLVTEEVTEPRQLVVRVTVDPDGQGPSLVLEDRMVTVNVRGGAWEVVSVTDV